jgi:hypothetical protein
MVVLLGRDRCLGGGIMVHGRMRLRSTCQHQGTGKLLKAGVRPPTVGEWLEEWLAAKKGLRAGTERSYGSHIRLYLSPCVGLIPLDRLRVADVASVFDYVGDLNEAVTAAARANGDPELRNAVKGRRLLGPASCQRIRATLRSAISAYMRQHPGVLPTNVAALPSCRPVPGLRAWSGPGSGSGRGSRTSRPGSPPPAQRAGGSIRSASGSPRRARPRS